MRLLKALNNADRVWAKPSKEDPTEPVTEGWSPDSTGLRLWVRGSWKQLKVGERNADGQTMLEDLRQVWQGMRHREEPDQVWVCISSTLEAIGQLLKILLVHTPRRMGGRTISRAFRYRQMDRVLFPESDNGRGVEQEPCPLNYFKRVEWSEKYGRVRHLYTNHSQYIILSKSFTIHRYSPNSTPFRSFLLLLLFLLLSELSFHLLLFSLPFVSSSRPCLH